MRYLLFACLTLPLLADPAKLIDQIDAHATKVRFEATEVAQEVKTRNLALVEERARLLRQHATALQTAVADLESRYQPSSDEQREELQRLKAAAKEMTVLVDAKVEALNGVGADKKRGWLRSRAEGIAKQSEVVLRSAARLRS